MEVIIALRANLGVRETYLKHACDEISIRIGGIIACSKFIDTAPLVLPGSDSSSQPRYLNAVLIAESQKPPEEILKVLLQIEHELGRVRGETDVKWGPRLIDLDLIAVGDLVVESETLTLPHSEMHKRDFVLKPLVEILPEWIHPVFRKKAVELLTRISD